MQASVFRTVASHLEDISAYQTRNDELYYDALWGLRAARHCHLVWACKRKKVWGPGAS